MKDPCEGEWNAILLHSIPASGATIPTSLEGWWQVASRCPEGQSNQHVEHHPTCSPCRAPHPAGSITVGALKQLCERLFRMPVVRQALFVAAPGDPLPDSIGEDDSQNLSFFNVQVGLGPAPPPTLSVSCCAGC